MNLFTGLLQSSQFVQFAYLQTLDLLSTAAFLLRGVSEGNPFVRLMIHISPNPMWGLAFVKCLAVALALACVKMGKTSFLSKINMFYAALIVWNLFCLVVAS